MQISARYQAVFEILSEVFEDKKPADVIMSNYMKLRKYIGSKDRRFILDTSWEIIRRRMRLSFDAKSMDARKILLMYLKDEDFDIITGGTYGLEPLTQDEKKWLKSMSTKEDEYAPYVELECPEWLFEKIGNEALLRALNAPASVDIRANFISKLELKNRLKGEGLFFSLAPYSPHGLRSSERININNCVAYQEGLFDLQDESSQVAAVLINPKPNEKIVDYCAGAGGKSLAMGAELKNDGLILCHDVNFNRMDAIKARAERLGVKNLKLIKEVTDFDFDCFVVDAPCSGSGTFRRAPDAKFRLTPERLDELSKMQS
ncbi:MAG: RsmB/NOP family class I SAM-dependent RNA methyltransferase [Alphaproteobacteria bacterium]|nr:RsmB/NOP family class I SAM-dependent RNA methyltransferase [Alphaproteobacteria bacterium]